MLSAKEIRIFLDLTGDRPLIKMLLDGVEYVMLTIRGGPMAYSLQNNLRYEFDLEEPVMGMAFDYGQSVDCSELVIHEDKKQVGIYVKASDLSNKSKSHAKIELQNSLGR